MNTGNQYFESKISSRNIIKPNKLAIITSFFNPYNHISLKYNYMVFENNMKAHGDLFPIELSLTNNFFIEHNNVIRIKGKHNNILFQKEALLNIVLDELPSEYTDVAWVDCDVVFENKYWSHQLYNLLNRYKIVQLFNAAYKLNETSTTEGNKMMSIIDHQYGVCGYAWASRREVIDEIKLLDNQIVGGSDYIMAHTFMNQLDKINKSKFYIINNDDTKKWINNASIVVGESIASMNNELYHLYSYENTKLKYSNYKNVIDILNTTNNTFNYYKNSDKIWETNTGLGNAMFKYLYSSKNDDDIIDLNIYFDQIYLINLDRDTEKLKNISTILEKQNINYRRFSAIDGNLLVEHEITDVTEKHRMNVKGCLLSHLSIVKNAKQNSYKRILILEDDILFNKNWKIYLQKLKLLNNNWKLLYLGASQHHWDNIKYINGFHYCNHTVGAFAYGIDCSVYDKIIEYVENDMETPFDNTLVKIQKEYHNLCYVVYPNIIIANVEESALRPSREQISHGEKMRWNILSYEKN